MRVETSCFYVIVGLLSAVLSQLWGRGPDPDRDLQNAAGHSSSGLRLPNGAKAISHPALPQGELRPGDWLARWRLGPGEHCTVTVRKSLIALPCTLQASFDLCSRHFG